MLGWCVVGLVADNNEEKISCNRTPVMEARTRITAIYHSQLKNDVKETDIKKMVLKMYHNDFIEPTLEKENTIETDGLSVEGKRYYLSLVEE